MSKHQKKTLITNVCVSSGIILVFFGIALMSIFGFCISDKNLAGMMIFVAFLLVIIGFALLIIASRMSAKYAYYAGRLRSMLGPPVKEFFAYAGVPNNSFSEFDIPISKFLPEVLQAQEITKGVYEIDIEEQKYTFDMRGWIHKEYYIYEIILTKIQTKFMIKKKVNSLCNSLETSPLFRLKLEFIKLNGKKKTYILIQDGRSKVTARYKHNMKQKIVYFHHCEKLNVNPLYDFNE